MHQAEWRAVLAMNTRDSTSSGYRSAHSSACIPPSEPPITIRIRFTPSEVTSACWARTMSRTVMAGKAPSQGRPVAGSTDAGPVVP